MRKCGVGGNNESENRNPQRIPCSLVRYARLSPYFDIPAAPLLILDKLNNDLTIRPYQAVVGEIWQTVHEGLRSGDRL